MTTQEKVGKQIKQARKDEKLTQKEVAKILNIIQPAYARYESGRIQLNYDQIIELCKAINTTPNYIFMFDEI